jgi:hypothetical protein
MAKPHSASLRNPARSRRLAPLPAGRAPYLLVPDPDALLLVCPTRKKRGGPSPQELELARSIIARLPSLPEGPAWIDPATGRITAATIGAEQVRRRLIDDVSFNVRRP